MIHGADVDATFGASTVEPTANRAVGGQVEGTHPHRDSA